MTVNDLNGPVSGGTTKVYQLTTTNVGGVLGVQTDGEYASGTDITKISLLTRQAVYRKSSITSRQGSRI